MIRIIDLPVSSAAGDPDHAAATVTRTARRLGGLQVVGLGTVNDRLLIWLEPAEGGEVWEYHFAELEDGPSVQETVAEIQARYYAGFRTVGFFEYGPKRWGLFARKTESN